MSPEDFLALARDLIRRQDANEAARRSATSRAYYSAFNALAGELASKVAPLPVSGTHDHLIRWIRNSKVSGSEALADDLSDLRDRRVEADYFLGRPTASMNTVQLHIAQASAVVKDFQDLPRPALYDGIRAYRKSIGQV